MPVTTSTASLRVLLPLLLSLHALSSSLILPTLPLLTVEDSSNRQWAFSALILGFGSTQIVWGSLADRWGRRPSLICGLVLFVLASSGCFFASSLPPLLVCRWLQGAGVAAAGVCARAIIRDLHSAQQSIVVLSRCFSWISAISLAGPVLGGMLVARYGMPGALAAYGLLGLVALASTVLLLNETLDTSKLADASVPAGKWSDIWRHPVFRTYTALTASSYIGHYLFLSNSAFLLMEQRGMSSVEYGAVLSLCSLLYWAGTVLCRRALATFGLRETVRAASLAGLAGGMAMGLLAISGDNSAAAIIFPYMLFVLAHAIHQSCGQAAAMAPFKWAAGRASAALGTTLPVVAVCTGSLLAPGMAAASSSLPLAVCAAAILTAGVAWIWVHQHGDIAAY